MNSTDKSEPVEQPNDEVRAPKQDPIELEEANQAADKTADDDDDDDLPKGPSELDSLKIRAKTLGVTHSPNIGVDTLRAKIEEHIQKLEEARMPKAVQEAAAESMKAAQADVDTGPARIVGPTASERNKLPPMSVMLAMSVDDLMRQPEKRRTQIIRARQKHEQLALVRCQIHNNNPAKNDLFGEIFSVQNKYLGTVRKFIPYGKFTENGYHVPRILVNMLKKKRYIQVRPVKNPDGTERTETSQAPEFTITELRPLTRDELAKLASMQAARGSSEMGFVGTN